MTKRPTHKVRASECGGARRGDGLSGSWEEVDCPTCLACRPVNDVDADHAEKGWPTTCHADQFPVDRTTCGRLPMFRGGNPGGASSDWRYVGCPDCLRIGAAKGNADARARLERRSRHADGSD